MSIRAVLFGSLTFCLVNLSVSTQAQTVPTLPDSSRLNQPDESRAPRRPGLSKPGRAALYSAILPGAGQFYNKDYWKVPVVYVVGGTLFYFYNTNNSQYQKYLHDYRAHQLDDPVITTKYPGTNGANYLRLQRDYYRRNRDLTIMISILAYGMQIVEATVGAHMNEFDISDDLSMNWHPSFQTTFPGSAPVPALSFNFRFTK
jgi:hypothetical protein